MGASLGGYHAANTILKHPDVVKRCFALSGVYDMRRFMSGDYDDNFYFNNPVDYMSNLSDGWALHHLASCDIHLATGTGPWEHRFVFDPRAAIGQKRVLVHHVDQIVARDQHVAPGAEVLLQWLLARDDETQLRAGGRERSIGNSLE
jgi:esterase/lipase superfamily enzyme